jgi:hypothetical protein
VPVSEARVRAPVTKSIVDLLEKQPRTVRDAVRESAASAIARVEQASRMDWIPLSVQLEIVAALHAQVGPREFDTFCAATFGSVAEQPLARSVFEGTLRVFGISPGPVYKMFGKTWAMVSSGAGVITVEGEPSPTGTVIRVSDLPIEERHIELYVRGFRATLRGVIEIVNKQGEVDMRSFHRGTREAIYVAKWA